MMLEREAEVFSFIDSEEFVAMEPDRLVFSVAFARRDPWSRADIHTHRSVTPPPSLHSSKRWWGRCKGEFISSTFPVGSLHLRCSFQNRIRLRALHNNMRDQDIGLPPPDELGTLLDIFLRRFSHHHLFFLDDAEFRHRPLSLGLLNTVCLWASKISPRPPGRTEEHFLALAIHHLARDVSATDSFQPPHRILDIIQAEILLSLFYFDAGRLFEGRYHCAAVTSLAFSAGLNKMGSASPTPYPPLVFAQSLLPVVQDPNTTTQMIDAFWGVVVLNNYWVAASGIPSSIPSDPSISTPWPTHQPFGAPPPLQFSSDNDVYGHSPHTLLAKASILLERTIATVARNPGMSPSRVFSRVLISTALPNPEFWALEPRLESFRSHLPPLHTTTPTDQISLITHALVNAAIIRMHAPLSDTCPIALYKCFTAATCIVSHLRSTNLVDWDHADPILGPLLGAVSDFYVSQISAFPTAGSDLRTTLSFMHTLARWSPLIPRACELLMLPQELIDTVIHELHQRSLFRAIQARHLHLPEEVTETAAFLAYIDSNPQLASYVKSLGIIEDTRRLYVSVLEGEAYLAGKAVQLARLISLLPRIQIFSFDSTWSRIAPGELFPLSSSALASRPRLTQTELSGPIWHSVIPVEVAPASAVVLDSLALEGVPSEFTRAMLHPTSPLDVVHLRSLTHRVKFRKSVYRLLSPNTTLLCQLSITIISRTVIQSLSLALLQVPDVFLLATQRLQYAINSYDPARSLARHFPPRDGVQDAHYVSAYHLMVAGTQTSAFTLPARLKSVSVLPFALGVGSPGIAACLQAAWTGHCAAAPAQDNLRVATLLVKDEAWNHMARDNELSLHSAPE
ncbi:hypothetical protein DFH09DRAFT_1412679 [Mycena vulgaris]|nr:hypothetical protein DFH09DRAFT_1412679 [Mycena vulgaris]